MKQYLVVAALLLQSVVLALSTGSPIELSLSGNNGPPSVAVAANGNAVAVWNDFNNQIYGAFFNATTNAWASPFLISFGSVPQVAIDAVGNAIVVWVTTSGTVNQINASRFDATSSAFSTSVLVSTTGGINAAPQISMNDSGVALVVWTQSNPFQVLASSFNPTTLLFSTPVVFLNNTVPADFEIDDLNTGIAVWQSFPSGAIQAARLFVP